MIFYKIPYRLQNLCTTQLYPVPPETIATIEHLSSVPITAAKVKWQTDRDPILCKVKRYTQHGWPDRLNSNEAELKLYFHRKQELSLEDGILLWGNRAVIPVFP